MSDFDPSKYEWRSFVEVTVVSDDPRLPAVTYYLPCEEGDWKDYKLTDEAKQRCKNVLLRKVDESLIFDYDSRAQYLVYKISSLWVRSEEIIKQYKEWEDTQPYQY